MLLVIMGYAKSSWMAQDVSTRARGSKMSILFRGARLACQFVDFSIQFCSTSFFVYAGRKLINHVRAAMIFTFVMAPNSHSDPYKHHFNFCDDRCVDLPQILLDILFVCFWQADDDAAGLPNFCRNNALLLSWILIIL